MPVAPVESLDREGRGVARVGGKTVFIDGALPGESVEYVARKAKPSYELARLTRALSESAARVAPRCPHFGVCGGCAMQHLEPRAQVATKHRVLEKKGAVLVGFRERRSTHVAEMTRCEVLPPRESALIVPLRELIGELAVRDRVPQVEIAIGEAVTVLVLRLLAPLTAADEPRVRRFADAHAVQVWLQPGGPDTARPFHPLDAPPLFYTLPEFGIQIHFLPTDFTQVNYETNAMLVRSAMRLLEPRPGEPVLDLFSGLGNFALPVACAGAEVIGLEGNAGLVARARENARRNGLAARFEVADLFRRDVARALPRANAMLLDPPREGAIEIVKALGDDAPGRIVYVSCDPATLARDAGVLAHVKGYRLAAAGVVNMFPHTGHVESLALFERG